MPSGPGISGMRERDVLRAYLKLVGCDDFAAFSVDDITRVCLTCR